MTKETKRPISNITQDSIKPLLSNAVEFYTNKNREAHKCIQERDEYINYLESKLSNAKPQQALPVVPEWLDIEIKHFKSTSKHPTVDVVFGVADAIVAVKNGNTHSKLYDYLFCGKQNVCNQHQAIFSLAFITGKYEVEKPQLFYIALPKVYGLSYSTFVSKAESGIISEFTRGKDYALKLTEQEIKSIDERYWQFAVPVEDGE
ncbi:DUF1642 domain-containing protein [Lactococcus cremoris]|uniref:DUF1642 domain-containing protein n=1 Tax=Lactococcus lactis subsp. cremoris TaxID=1359 RepID=UPI0025A1B643|nr:DUF1642 domain-containing protein [Lactococcus cremoris]MDM7655042.1 DUF1642 domain-containing protein [Lactococcus cremoris]